MNQSRSWVIPYRKLDWRKVLVMAFVAYALAFALRAIEIPCWNNPDYQLDGEYLLGTHDAYYWMAGAEGFGRGVDHPFSRLVHGLSVITGEAPGNVGFWLPLVLSPLVASIVCVWAMVFGARNSGVVAGVLACMAPGFLGRTLLGYCDTDLVTLLFALLIGLVPAMWLAPAMRSPLAVAGSFAGLGVRKLASVSPKEARGDPLDWRWLLALFLSGIFGYWAKDWHSLFSYLTVWYALLVPTAILLFSVKSERGKLWRGGVAYVLPLVGGVPGALLGGVLLACLKWKKCPLRKYALDKRFLAGIWLLALIAAFDPALLAAFVRGFGSYLKSSGDISGTANATESIVFPGVAQSIIEVQDLSLKDLLFYFHPWSAAVLVGVAGFLVLLSISPAAAFHLPLIALSFLSLKLGGRMVMFGVASISLGMVVPFCLLIERYMEKDRVKGWIRALPIPDLMLLFLLIPYISLVPRLSQGPILNVEHARALKSLRETTPQDAIIWTWWDWGYATQYFSLRKTIADGAMHGGPHLYLPAAVYSTDNPRLASQLILYTSQEGGPVAVFEDKSAQEITALLGKWASSAVDLNPQSEQYLVVSFDMLRLGFWISKHGSWDFVEKTGEAEKITRIKKSLKYSLNSGLVEINGSDPLQADSIDVLTKDGLVRESYFRFNQRHFILNFLNGDKLILNDGLYNSMLAQLLLSGKDDPRFKNYFTPIFDNVYCKIYRIK